MDCECRDLGELAVLRRWDGVFAVVVLVVIPMRVGGCSSFERPCGLESGRFPPATNVKTDSVHTVHTFTTTILDTTTPNTATGYVPSALSICSRSTQNSNRCSNFSSDRILSTVWALARHTE